MITRDTLREALEKRLERYLSGAALLSSGGTTFVVTLSELHIFLDDCAEEIERLINEVLP